MVPHKHVDPCMGREGHRVSWDEDAKPQNPDTKDRREVKISKLEGQEKTKCVGQRQFCQGCDGIPSGCTQEACDPWSRASRDRIWK